MTETETPKKRGRRKPPPANIAAAQEARRRITDEDVFTYVRSPAIENAEKPLPPQAETILNAIKAAGPEGITRSQLVKVLSGALETRQPISRVLTFYQPRLKEFTTITFGPERVAQVQGVE